MRTRVTVLTLCVCVCVCLLFLAPSNVYITLIMAIGFVQNAKGFQLTDFSEKASFKSYSIFFARFTTWQPFYFVDMLTQYIDMHTARAH